MPPQPHQVLLQGWVGVWRCVVEEEEVEGVVVVSGAVVRGAGLALHAWQHHDTAGPCNLSQAADLPVALQVPPQP